MKTAIKKFALILVIMIGVQTEKSFAQTPSWQWAKSAGLTGSEAATGTALDAAGNLYVTGWYTSANITFGAITLVNMGSGTSDIFLVKYDPAGNAIWAISFGGIDGDIGNGIAVDAAGNVHITGWFTSANVSFGTYTVTNAGVGSSDVFIAKFNSSGTALWAKSGGGTSADRGYGIALDATGNVFTTGGFSSTSINFGTGSLTNAGSATNDLFIVKHDQNGTALWAKIAGGTGSDIGFSAATDSLGNVYVTGAYSSSAIDFGIGGLTNSMAGTQDLFIVRYNGSGIPVWSVRSGGSMDDFGNAIAVQKGNVYVTGGFNSSSVAFGTTTLTNISAATSDVLLAKYDLNGNSVWANRAGDTDSEAGNGVAIDAVGNVFVSGYFISNSIAFGITTLTNAAVGYRDLFVAAYSGSGNVAWATSSTGGTYDETANAISVNGNGTDVYVGGTFNSPAVTFGIYNIYKGCGDDVFVAKLLGPAMVGIKEEYLVDQFTIYPNPSTGKFTVEAQAHIIFYNTLGEMILSEKLKSQNQFGQTEFDFSSQPKGVYMYRVSSEKKGTFTGKIVVE